MSYFPWTWVNICDFLKVYFPFFLLKLEFQLIEIYLKCTLRFGQRYILINLSVFRFLFQINLGIYIKDESTEMSVLVDRSVGGSSVNDGEVEIMLHRLLLCSFFLADSSLPLRK